MSKIMIMKSFELNSIDLLDDWKTVSETLNSNLKGADGFISRDSLKGSGNKVFCCVKWESEEKKETFRKKLEAKKEWPEIQKNLKRVINMETMNMQVLEVL